MSNYLAQTVFGMLLLDAWLDRSLNRTGLALFVIALAVLQGIWSYRWLRRYRYGPMEWLWRIATYRHWVTLRRSAAYGSTTG